MMHKHTLIPRLFAFVLSIFVMAGSLFAWTMPAVADDDPTEAAQAEMPAGDTQDQTEPSSEDTQDKAADTSTDSKQDKTAASTGGAKKKAPASNDKNKAATPTEQEKANNEYTLTYSDNEGNEEQVAYEGTSTEISALDLFKNFYGDEDVSADSLSVDKIEPASTTNVSYDTGTKKFTISGTFNDTVTVTFKVTDDENEYPVSIACTAGKPWDGKKTASGEAMYGNSDTVDLSECLPTDDELDDFGTLSKKDEDSILDDNPDNPSASKTDKKLSYAFVDNGAKVGKTAKVVIPVTIKDNAYSPYKITVDLKVLDKNEQNVTAEDFEGTEGQVGAKLSASTDGDGALSYEVIEGEDYVEVNEETGALSLKQEGEAKVRVTASETDTYKDGSVVVTVKVNPRPTYNVVVSDDGHGVATADPGTDVTAGTTVKLTATPDDGYTFSKWEVITGDVTLKSTTSKSTSFTMPDSDVEVKANFKKKAETRSITFKANGGTGTMTKQTAEKGSTVTLKANKFKRTGYTFTGWNTKKDGTGATFKNKAKVKLNANATLYAQWKKNSSSSSKKKSSSSSSSSRSSESLAQTNDPTNTSLITALTIGGAALVGVGYYASKKRGKGQGENEEVEANE